MENSSLVCVEGGGGGGGLKKKGLSKEEFLVYLPNDANHKKFAPRP